MFRHEVELRIVEALRRFKSLSYESLIHEILNRDANFSARNEEILRDSLVKLRQEGTIVSDGGLFGEHSLPAPVTHKNA